MSSDQRALLLDVATAQFAAHGFEATSVQQIASAASVSKAKVFYYFDGKEDIYARVLERALEPLMAPLESAAPSSCAASFWCSLESGLSYAFGFVKRDPHAASLVRDLYRRGADSPSLRRLVERTREAITHWLSEGQQLGAVRTDLPVAMLAEAALGALVHIDRWLASTTDSAAGAEKVMSSAAFAQFASDALGQQVPVECDVSIAYTKDAADDESDTRGDKPATQSHPIRLRNARLWNPSPRFGREGFELVEAPWVFAAHPEDDEARAAFGAIESHAKAHLGAEFARVFDYTVRHTGRTPGRRPPIFTAHGDYGQDADTELRRRVLTVEELDRFAGARVIVAKLWQSVAGVVHSTPLACADIRTVGHAELVLARGRSADRDGEIAYYRFDDKHRWYWFPFLHPTEALLLKTFDSAAGESHWSCPHAAVTVPSSPKELDGLRTSIEFHVLLVFGPDTPGSS